MHKSILPQTFYVYVHRKATTGAVFYVGKGTGKRAWRNEARNNLWVKTADKYGVVVEVVHAFGDEALAFELECELILHFGRINTRTGCLVNMTDGGEGSTGQVQTDAKREKIRAASLGLKRSPEFSEACRVRMMNFRHTPESRAKISLAHLGKTISAEHAAAVSRAQTGRKRSSEFIEAMSKRVVCIETGDSFASQLFAVEWAASQGIAVHQGSISNCCRGLRKTAGGLRWMFEPAPV